MKLLFSIAIAYLKNHKRQSMVSVGGVMIGVGFFIGIAAMMQGFQIYFVQKVIDVSPHIIIKDEYRLPPIQPVAKYFPEAHVDLRGLKPKEELRGIRESQRILEELSRMEGLAVAPILTSQVFLRYGSRDVSSSLIGIDPEKERHVSNLERDLVAGELPHLLTSANGIILGKGLADKLGAGMGDILTAVSPAGVIMTVKVVGIFNTGITVIDMMDSYMVLKKVQILAKKERVVNQLRLRIAEVEKAEALAREMEARYGYRTESWQETNQNVFSIFIIQNGIMYSTVSAILIVAGFGIYNIISTVVNEKRRDIAILKSMGFSEKDIRIVFLFQGMVVGVLGIGLGWLLGWGIIEFLASVKIKLEGFITAEGFVLNRSLSNYAIAGMVAMVASTLAAYVPARRAAKLLPVDIIRGDIQ